MLWLRVIAHDDTKEAQEAKMRAVRAARGAKPLHILSAAGSASGYPARARLRIYKRRPTLEIALGGGKGHNWFGFLYPEGLAFCSPGPGESFEWPLIGWLFNLLGIH